MHHRRRQIDAYNARRRVVLARYKRHISGARRHIQQDAVRGQIEERDRFSSPTLVLTKRNHAIDVIVAASDAREERANMPSLLP